MLLRRLLENTEIVYSNDIGDIDIKLITNDSRNANSNSLFIAYSSYVEDAHKFVESAYNNGCRYFVIDKNRSEEFSSKFKDSFFIVSDNLVKDISLISSNFYCNPSSKLKMIGITGTSGKTTTTFAIYNLLKGIGKKVGLIGTIEYRINDKIIQATNTTPDILFLNELLYNMVQEGVEYVVMEVSSHALSLGRVEGLNFDVVAFTNFSQDHLDFHKTMEEYFIAKCKIFDLLEKSNKNNKFAFINRDIEYYGKIMDYLRQFHTFKYNIYSCYDKNSDYFAEILEITPEYSIFKIQNIEIKISMIGMTNVYNFLVALSILDTLGFGISSFKNLTEGIRVNGRMDRVDNPFGITVVIDYAHKPDALEKLIKTLKETLKNKDNHLITVFGAGGDRDKLKRPIMGRIAGLFSDKVIITSDNPRTEDPLSIINEIENGIKETNNKNYWVEIDRRKAIRMALDMAKKGDIVIIAGKGHENYQIIGKNKIHFSDKEEVENYFKEKSNLI